MRNPFRRKSKDYSVQVSSDDWVLPEETLLDSGSKLSDMERPISSSVFSFAFWSMAALFVLIGVFTANLSVVRHDYFGAIAMQNSTANFFIPPPRGIIYDRNGETLVKNLPSFDILVISREIKENPDQLYKDILKISDIIGVNNLSLIRI